MLYADPSGYSWFSDAWDWASTGVSNAWDWFWDTGENFAQHMDEIGISSGGVGINSNGNTFHWIGNSGNIYHNQLGNDYAGLVDGAINDARFAMDFATNSSSNPIGYGGGISSGGNDYFSGASFATFAPAVTLTGTAAMESTTAATVSNPIGLVIAMPFALTGDTRIEDYDKQRRPNFSYVTYKMCNYTSGQVYVGRASGYGTPQQVLARRHRRHHMTKFGYSQPVIDRFIMGRVRQIDAMMAIRGREQQLIDYYGGIGSPLLSNQYNILAMLGNRINGISPINKMRDVYMMMSNIYFGPMPKSPFVIK